MLYDPTALWFREIGPDQPIRSLGRVLGLPNYRLTQELLFTRGTSMNLSIRTKLITACLMLGIIPALVIGAVAWSVADFMAEKTANEYLSIAANVADKIDRNLFERYGDVQAFGLNHAVHNRDVWYERGERNPIVQVMNSYVDTYDIYYLTMLVDVNGKLIAVNTRDDSGKRIETEWLYDQDYSQRPWFRDCLSADFYESDDGTFTGTVVEDLYVDNEVCRVFGVEGLSLGFSAPVVDSAGNVVAVWKNVAKFGLVEEIVWATYQELEERGLGSAELTLLDDKGNIIVDCDPHTHGTDEIVRDMKIIGRFNLAEKGVEAAERVVSGTAGYSTQSFHARKQINQCAGFTPHRGALGFPGMRWNVLVRVAEKEALAAVHRLKTQLMAVAILIIGIVPIVSIFFTRRMTKPIRHTMDVLSEMATGDLTKRLNSESKDEFGQLAGSLQRLC